MSKVIQKDKHNNRDFIFLAQGHKPQSLDF